MKLHCFVILERCQKGNFYFIQLIFMPLRIVTTVLSTYEYVIIAIYKSFQHEALIRLKYKYMLLEIVIPNHICFLL